MTNDFTSTKASYVGILSGMVAYRFLPFMSVPITRSLVRKNNLISKEENDTFWKAGMEAYKNSVLNEPVPTDIRNPEIKQIKKKAEIIHIDENNLAEVLNLVNGKFQQRKVNPVIAIIKNIFSILHPTGPDFWKRMKIIAEGRNACCYSYATQNSSLILINKDKKACALFHEMGHAINAHSNPGLRKFLSNTRHDFRGLIPAVFLTALFTPKPDKYSDDKKSKYARFINNNCGLIAGGLTLPTVAEEGFASINGAKMAKGVLSKDMYKKLNRLNTRAWLTYVTGAITTALTVQAAVALKNKIEQSAK